MSNKIPKDQIEREFNEARELNEYYEKEIEKLKKENEELVESMATDKDIIDYYELGNYFSDHSVKIMEENKEG